MLRHAFMVQPLLKTVLLGAAADLNLAKAATRTTATLLTAQPTAAAAAKPGSSTSSLAAQPNKPKAASAAPVLGDVFTAASKNDTLGLQLLECPTGSVLPAIRARPARVEDHDDLLPIVFQAALRCGIIKLYVMKLGCECCHCQSWAQSPAVKMKMCTIRQTLNTLFIGCRLSYSHQKRSRYKDPL